MVSRKAEAPPVEAAGRGEHVTISAPKMETATFAIIGTAPYVMDRFPERALTQMHETQAAGQAARSKKTRAPKDFQQRFQDAQHRALDGGWVGLPANAFRNAMISACRLIGFKMTLAKLSVFVEDDGWDSDGTPLVKLQGEPEYFESAGRNKDGGVDLRVRAKFAPGWKATLRVRFDAEQFTTRDVANLLMRAGMQVGIGNGRPDSRASAGMGWGTFRLETSEE